MKARPLAASPCLSNCKCGSANGRKPVRPSSPRMTVPPPERFADALSVGVSDWGSPPAADSASMSAQSPPVARNRAITALRSAAADQMQPHPGCISRLPGYISPQSRSHRPHSRADLPPHRQSDFYETAIGGRTACASAASAPEAGAPLPGAHRDCHRRRPLPPGRGLPGRLHREQAARSPRLPPPDRNPSQSPATPRPQAPNRRSRAATLTRDTPVGARLVPSRMDSSVRMLRRGAGDGA